MKEISSQIPIDIALNDNGAQENLDALNASLIKMADNGKSAMNSLQKLSKSLGLFKVSINLFDALKASIAGAFQKIDAAEYFVTALSKMNGNAQLSASALGLLDSILGGTNYQFNTAADAVLQFVRAGLSIEQATNRVKIWGDAVAFYGAGSDTQFRAVTTALTEMQAEGTVSMDQLNRLYENGIDAVGMYAQVTNRNSESVRADLLSGKISAADFVGTVTAAMNTGAGGVQQVAGAAKDSEITWSGAFTRMKTATVDGAAQMLSAIDGGLTRSGLPTLRELVLKVGEAVGSTMAIVGGAANLLLYGLGPAIHLITSNLNVFIPIMAAATAAFAAHKVVGAWTSAVSGASKAVETSGKLLDQLNAIQKSHNIVEEVTSIMKNKRSGSEATIIALTKAGMKVNKDNILVTSAGVRAEDKKIISTLNSSAAISKKNMLLMALTGQLNRETLSTMGVTEATAKETATKMIHGKVDKESLARGGLRVGLSNKLLLASIKLTAATTADTSAKVKNSAASGIGTAVTGALAAAKSVCAVATLALAAAVKTLMGPLTIIIAVIAAVVAGVILLVKWLTKESEASKKATEENKKLKESAEGVSEAVGESNESFKKNKDSIEWNAKQVDGLQQKLIALSKVENKSAEQKLEMQKYTQRLNNSVDDLGLSYDAETDSLNMSEAALKSRTKAMIEQAEAQAYQERYKEILKEQADIEIELEKIQRQRSKIDEELVEGTREYKKAVEDLRETEEDLLKTQDEVAISFDIVEGKVLETMAATSEMAENGVQSLKDAYDDLTDHQKETADRVTSTYQKMSDGLKNLNREIVEDRDTTWESSKANQDKMIGQTEEFTELYAELVKAGVSESYLEALGANSVEALPLLRDMNEAGIGEIKAAQAEWESAYEANADTFIDAFGMDAQTADALKEFVLGETGIMGCLGDAIKDSQFQELWSGVPAGAKEVIEEEIPVAAEAGKELGETVTEEVATGISETEPQITSAISSLAANVAGSGAADFTTLAQNLSAPFRNIPDEISKAIQPAVGILKSWLQTLTTTMKSGADKLGTTLLASFRKIPAGIEAALKPAVQKVGAWGIQLNIAGSSAGRGFQSAVEGTLRPVPGAVQKAIDPAVQTVKSWGGELKTAGKSAGTALKDGILSAVKSLPNQMKDCGVQMINGLIRGIESRQSSLYAVMRKTAKEAVKAAKKELDIRSPSRVFEREVGGMMMAGWLRATAQGGRRLIAEIADTASGASRAAAQAADRVNRELDAVWWEALSGDAGIEITLRMDEWEDFLRRLGQKLHTTLEDAAGRLLPKIRYPQLAGKSGAGTSAQTAAHTTQNNQKTIYIEQVTWNNPQDIRKTMEEIGFLSRREGKRLSAL